MWQNNTYANTHTTTDKTEISYGQIPYRYAVISVTHWILVLLGSAFHSEYALLTFAKYRRKGKARRLAIYGGCTIDVEYFISINGKRLCSPILCHLMASGFSSCFTVVLYIRTCFWKILSRRKCKFQFAHVYICMYARRLFAAWQFHYISRHGWKSDISIAHLNDVYLIASVIGSLHNWLVIELSPICFLNFDKIRTW